MSLPTRSNLMTLLGLTAILHVGCGAPVVEDMAADGGDGMPPWTPPRSGMTGLPGGPSHRRGAGRPWSCHPP